MDTGDSSIVMTIVTSPNATLQLTKSIRGVLTLVKSQEGVYSIKKYSKPLPFSGPAFQTITAIIEVKRQEWGALSQAQKDAWQVIADEVYMTGEELYKSEGFKEGMTSFCGLAVCGMSYCG